VFLLGCADEDSAYLSKRMPRVGTLDDARVSTVVNTPKGRDKRDISLPAIIPLMVQCSLHALNLISSLKITTKEASYLGKGDRIRRIIRSS